LKDCLDDGEKHHGNQENQGSDKRETTTPRLTHAKRGVH
jgi:hypothetical protein